jgi:hypothetical protein
VGGETIGKNPARCNDGAKDQGGGKKEVISTDMHVALERKALEKRI